MSKISWQPEYFVLKKEENRIEVKLSFSSNLDFFKGHFKDFKIVPGVVQSHFAVFLSQELWQIKEFPKNFPSVKFMNPIFPDNEIFLILEKKHDKKIIQFEFKSSDKIHAKGSWKFS